MSLLGILDNDKLCAEINEALTKIGENTLVIKRKDNLNGLNGLIIPITDRGQITETISWLIECKNYSTLFVWIFSTIQLKNEKPIFIQLGANAIVSDENQFSNFIQLIKNDIQRVEVILEDDVSESINVINSKNQSVYVNGEEIGLTRKEYNLLSLLYKNKSVCVSYKEIANVLWPSSSQTDTLRIANVIFNLRNKVRSSKHFTIRTIRNKGYMFCYKNQFLGRRQ